MSQTADPSTSTVVNLSAHPGFYRWVMAGLIGLSVLFAFLADLWPVKNAIDNNEDIADNSK